jgi:hypothetical protein
MAVKTKAFNCIRMKDEIQAKMLKEEAAIGKTVAEKRRKMWLEKSNDELALWWRSVKREGKTEGG